MSRDREYIIYNGELLNEQPTTQVYVYQDIHTLGHKPRHTSRHLHLIDYAADKLFGLHCRVSITELEQQITTLLDSNHTTRNTSVCVRLKVYATGDYSLQQLRKDV